MQIKCRKDLHQLLNPVKKHLIVEVGVAEGYFSQLMSAWGDMILIDNWATLDQKGDGSNDQAWHDENYRQAKERCPNATFLKGISWEMAKQLTDESCSLIYIDACHSYECVYNDINAFYPKLEIGGIMGFHDYLSTEYGVKQAVDEFAGRNNLQMNIIPEFQDSDASAYFIKI